MEHVKKFYNIDIAHTSESWSEKLHIDVSDFGNAWAIIMSYNHKSKAVKVPKNT